MTDQLLVDNPVLTDNDGNPLAGGQVEFYETGTTTPVAIYESDGVTPLTNPITADSLGRVTAVYVTTSTAVKAVIRDANGASVTTHDPCGRVSQSVNTASNISISPIVGLPRSGTPAATVQEALEDAAARIVLSSNFMEDTFLPSTSAAPARTALGLGDMALLAEADRTADQATWNTGTSTTEMLISPAKLTAKVDDGIGDTIKWGRSGALTPAANTTLAWSNGFGGAATSILVELVCTTADGTFSIGDRVVLSPGPMDFGGASHTNGITILNSSGGSISVVIGAGIEVLTDEATPAVHNIDFADWDLYITAQRFI